MKRILLISALLLAVIFTVSADRRRMLMTRNVAAAASTFDIGLSSIAANADTWGADYAICMRVQASASGTLQKAFIYVNNTAVADAKVCIYGPDTDSLVNAEDLKIGTSAAIAGGGSAGWWPSGGSSMSGGTVTSGQYYWLIIILNSSSPVWAVKSENSASVTYFAATGHYTSPPAAGSSFTGPGSGSFGRISAYVTAQ